MPFRTWSGGREAFVHENVLRFERAAALFLADGGAGSGRLRRPPLRSYAAPAAVRGAAAVLGDRGGTPNRLRPPGAAPGALAVAPALADGDRAAEWPPRAADVRPGAHLRIPGSHPRRPPAPVAGAASAARAGRAHPVAGSASGPASCAAAIGSRAAGRRAVHGLGARPRRDASGSELADGGSGSC